MADRPQPGAPFLAATSAACSEVLRQIIPNSTFVTGKTASEFALDCDASLIRYYSRRYFQFHDGFCSKTVNTSAIPYGGDAILDFLLSQRQAYERARAMLRLPRYLRFALEPGALQWPCGVVIGWHSHARARIRPRVTKDWHDFTRTRPFWRDEPFRVLAVKSVLIASPKIGRVVPPNMRPGRARLTPWRRPSAECLGTKPVGRGAVAPAVI